MPLHLKHKDNEWMRNFISICEDITLFINPETVWSLQLICLNNMPLSLLDYYETVIKNVGKSYTCPLYDTPL